MKSFTELEKNNGRFTYDQVSSQYGIPINRTKYLPGRIYSLTVKSPLADLREEYIPEVNNGKNYYDLNPIGLSFFTENFKEISIFLDFKVIPPTILSKILEAYYFFSVKNGLSSFYKNGNLIPLNERQLLDQRLYFITPSILSELCRASNFNYAINKYNNDQIIEARLIDWDNLGMLIQPKLSVKGLFPETINLVKVFEDFIDSSFK